MRGLMLAVGGGLAAAVLAAGCGGAGTQQAAAPAPAAEPAAEPDEVAAERAKLSPEDRALVDAQEWCVVSNDERLGGMGPPVKLTVKGQAVFLCCKGCQRTALADPDKTLATLGELKARKAGR